MFPNRIADIIKMYQVDARWVVLCILTLLFWNHYCVAQVEPKASDEQDGLPKGTDYVILFLPEPAKDPATEPPPTSDAIAEWRAQLKDVLKLPNQSAGVEYKSIYQLHQRFERQYRKLFGESRECAADGSPASFGDRIQSIDQQVKAARRNPESWNLDALYAELERLLENFKCETTGDPVSLETLRTAYILKGVILVLGGKPGEEILGQFESACSLGKPGETFDLDEEYKQYKAVWDYFTQAAHGMGNSLVDVFINGRHRPFKEFYLDGEQLTFPSGGDIKLKLRPGAHYVQIRDQRNRLRSALYPVGREYLQSGNRAPIVLEGVLKPMSYEYDDYLYEALSDWEEDKEASGLTPWLKNTLEAYNTDYTLRNLFIVANFGRRDGSPDPLVARFDVNEGLKSIPKEFQGDYYLPPWARSEPSPYKYEPFLLGGAVALSNLESRSFATGEVRAYLLPQRALWVEAGVSGGLDLSRAASGSVRWIPRAWIGLLREPPEPSRDWLGGFSIGLIAPGSRPKTSPEAATIPIIRATPAFHLGFEIPMHREKNLWKRGVANRPWARSCRLEVVSSWVQGLTAFGEPDVESGWMLELRVGLRLWRRVSKIPEIP